MPPSELELTPQMLIQALSAELLGREEFSGPEPVRHWAAAVCHSLMNPGQDGPPDKEALFDAARGAFGSMLVSESRDLLLMGAWHNPQAFARTLLLMLKSRQQVNVNYVDACKTMQ